MHKFRLLLLAVVFTAACSKSDNPGNNGDPGSPPDPPTEEGTPTPVGTPDGTTAATAVIGTGGGTLTSTDGQLKLTVPAGAFTTNQNVSIERISNNSPLKAGHAYRLKPEGVTFAKPVSLTFKYQQSDTLIYAPDASGIAYQNSKGVWMATPVTIEAGTGAITAQTTHFSDWSKYTFVHIAVKSPRVGPGGSTGLSVIVADGYLAPTNNDKPVPQNKPVSAASIKSWRIVSGPGRIEGTGSVVTFVAPPRITTPPESKTVVEAVVFAKVGQPKTFKLSAEIRTVQGFLKISINGGDEITLSALPVLKMGENMWQLATTGPAGSTGLVITWPFGVGTHGFSILPREDKAVVTLLHEGHNYGHTYIAGEDIFASPGFVKITSMGVIDGFVTGTFSVEKAGRFPTLKNSVSIEGSFQTTKITD